MGLNWTPNLKLDEKSPVSIALRTMGLLDDPTRLLQDPAEKPPRGAVPVAAPTTKPLATARKPGQTVTPAPTTLLPKADVTKPEPPAVKPDEKPDEKPEAKPYGQQLIEGAPDQPAPPDFAAAAKELLGKDWTAEASRRLQEAGLKVPKDPGDLNEMSGWQWAVVLAPLVAGALGGDFAGGAGEMSRAITGLVKGKLGQQERYTKEQQDYSGQVASLAEKMEGEADRRAKWLFDTQKATQDELDKRWNRDFEIFKYANPSQAEKLRLDYERSRDAWQKAYEMRRTDIMEQHYHTMTRTANALSSFKMDLIRQDMQGTLKPNGKKWLEQFFPGYDSGKLSPDEKLAISNWASIARSPNADPGALKRAEQLAGPALQKLAAEMGIVEETPVPRKGVIQDILDRLFGGGTSGTPGAAPGAQEETYDTAEVLSIVGQTGFIPADKWAQLTPDQQAQVKAQYPGLAVK